MPDPEKNRTSPSVHHSGTILLVDDDEMVLEGTRDIIQLAGYQTLLAHNGFEALELLETTTPDLIISDIMMPKMDGYTFYKTVRRNPDWISIPFIFLSARSGRRDIQQGYSLGVDRYLTKPFDPEDLIIAIRNRLERSAEIRDAMQSDVETTKKQILQVLGHELRTPLNYLYGYSNLFDEFTSLDQDFIEAMIRDMKQGTDRLVKLINNLMLLISIDAGVVQAELEYTSELVILRHAIEKVVNELQPLANKKNIAIITEITGEPVVKGTPRHIPDIFWNLIENAIKFGKPDGHVWVQVHSENDTAVISVRDDGLGIHADKQARLFDRFIQVDRDLLEQQGLGMGLSVVEALVQLHGGTIMLTSVPGQGSEFTVTLPVVMMPDSLNE